jgi:hypothetical protein
MLGEMHCLGAIDKGWKEGEVLEGGGGAEWGDGRCGEFLGKRVHGDAG